MKTLIELFQKPVKRRDLLLSKVFMQNGHLQETDWMSELDTIGNFEGIDRWNVGEMCLECDGRGIDRHCDAHHWGAVFGELTEHACESCLGTGFVLDETSADDDTEIE